MSDRHTGRWEAWGREARAIGEVLGASPHIDKTVRIRRPEFQSRQRKVMEGLRNRGIDAAIVYSDEHYNGDVPYLGGNTNITIEPVAGVIGPGGFHILAGLEGGYVAEQLAGRSGAVVHKVEMLKLADEEYPVDAERVEDVIEEAAGKRPKVIGLLTPREVLPVSVYEFLRGYMGSEDAIVDAQDIYYEIKYEKSEAEIDLTRAASQICDVMVRGMLAILKPGILETQVSSWGYLIGQELGSEEFGFDVMVTSGEANRTLIGKALNRPIREGDVVHIGVAPKRDGLTACERVSVVCTHDLTSITDRQRYWFRFVEGAFDAGLDAYREVASSGRPAMAQEQALVDYFDSRSREVSEAVGQTVDMTRQKPYTGTHNGGYTECQEFYGAITLNSTDPLGHRIVTMLDVAVRGVGDKWNDIVIPDLDFVLVERTLAKNGPDVEVLTKLPVNVQHLVGNTAAI